MGWVFADSWSRSIRLTSSNWSCCYCSLDSVMVLTVVAAQLYWSCPIRYPIGIAPATLRSVTHPYLLWKEWPGSATWPQHSILLISTSRSLATPKCAAIDWMTASCTRSSSQCSSLRSGLEKSQRCLKEFVSKLDLGSWSAHSFCKPFS